MEHTPQILCIGALHWDREIQCIADTVLDQSNPAYSRTIPGGVAFNVATTLAGLNCTAGLVSRVGSDPEGAALIDHLDSSSVNVIDVGIEWDMQTATYTAILTADGELLIGLADMDIYDGLDDRYWAKRKTILNGWDAWCIDTNLPESGLRYLCGQNDRPRLYALATSPAKITRLRTLLKTVDTLILNIAEASALTGKAHTDLDGAQGAAQLLCELGVHRALVTAGPAGAAWADSTGTGVIPGISQPSHTESVSGAGDSLAGVVIAALEQDQPTEISLQYGVQAGALALELSNTGTGLSWRIIKEHLDSTYG